MCLLANKKEDARNKILIIFKLIKVAGQISNDIKDTQTSIEDVMNAIDKMKAQERDINDNIAEVLLISEF